ncbi:DddA-like double-stranded DNA deaminase toxin [Streptomyces sp. NPDC001828]|uniref:DddA-like double-stranded DNA deaminase toxin n=1 Tax=Streptomyces sp. NPDC001828 TaxID=3364615 RepID=UPI0036AB2462
MLATGLLSGLMGAPSALAAEAPAVPADVRSQIVGYWRNGGDDLKLAAEQALLGGDDAVRKFLQDAPSIQDDDNRLDAARLAMTGGPEVRQAAKEAMGKSPSELERFLLDGFETAQDDDAKVDIARMVTLGGSSVREAGKEALLGTAEDRERFLQSGQYEARQEDNKVDVARMTNTGGPNVKAAAKVALRGTPDDIVEFLEIGQFVARNRDQEYASVAQLTEQAKEAGTQAEAATKQAEEDSKKAIEASDRAKTAAKNAAAQMQDTKLDSRQAAVKAKEAAAAARSAAQASQEAIGSANAANRAARRAALAASQTAAAAAGAAEAANKAYNAAIAAAGNASEAENARKSAAGARFAAQLATDSAVAAHHAGLASTAAKIASGAAKDAAANSDEAANSAEAANNYADAAGAHSSEARQAATEARRHANAARAAADRSTAYAARAAQAAFDARDCANSAAAHANKAADFADEAAQHAGDSAAYADRAKKNADAAKLAAEAAAAAVTKAKEVFTLAREGEALDLQTRTEGAIEQARSLKSNGEAHIAASASAQVAALSLNDTAATLAQVAAQPDVDVKATAAKGRELALQALKQLGPWHQEAAARALSGADQDVLDYLRTRWKEASEHDIRENVVRLSTQSPYTTVRTAAAEALKGAPEQIQGFYASGQYAVAIDEMKVDVARLTNTGGPSVAEAAKKALADGNGKVLATFLQVNQYSERVTDDRVIAARLTNTGGPEVKAAAKIALAGPPDLLHSFVATGQYMAQRKDDLAANHIHLVERLLAEGQQVAAKAMENRWRAAEAAARAKAAAADADIAVVEAKKSAAAADGYAAEAKTSANAAAASAADAAKSAATARAAAARAEQDATAAENSASDAEFSAAYARQSAQKANAAKADALQSALAAGKSHEEAEAASKDAWQSVFDLREKEAEEALRQELEERKRQEQDAKPKKVCVPFTSRESIVPLLPCLADPDNSEIRPWEDEPVLRNIIWELTGLNDIKECIQNPTAFGCTMAAAGVLPLGKLRLLGKIDKGVEALKDYRKTRRSVGCLVGAATHSFPAGTKVLMADGTGRPIEQVQPGDSVTATNPANGETGSRAVTRAIHTPDDRNFTNVTLTDASHLTSTDRHPYWVENRKRWIDAANLRVGDALRTPVGTAVQIGSISHWTGLQPAYDLTVDDLHTFYVSTGTTNVLVHNNDEGCPLWVRKALDKLPSSPEGATTEGYVFYPDGKPLWEKTVKSGVGENSEEINKYLRESKDFPDFRGYSSVSHHTEVKTAWEMRNKGGPGDMHIVINKNYVCPKVASENAAGCRQAVPAILYEDQTLWVHYPGFEKGIPLKGTVKRK